MINEIHPAVDATVLASKKKKSNLLKATREKAIRRLAIRAVIAAGLVALLALLGWLGWVIQPLAYVLEVGVMIWITVWFGAWLQFRFADGGLLDAE